MAGGHVKYRTLSRHSAHRQSLLRNLVTSLLTHETITTTWHKAKEAQRLAEKLITLGKKNTNASRSRANAILYDSSPNPLVASVPRTPDAPAPPMPPSLYTTLFSTLRTRYATRGGGYTRVLRTEPRNRDNDQAETAILELVDGPRDMRFAMTARTLARERELEGGIRDVTMLNVKKVTRYRPDGEAQLIKMADRIALGGKAKVEGEVTKKERRKDLRERLKEGQLD